LRDVPFRHVVLFRWAEHVDADHVARVRDTLDSLPDLIPQIRSFLHGADVGVSEGNFDYAIVADFDRVDDWRTYRDHPSHVLFVEELIKGHVASRAAVQYQTPTQRSPHDVSAAGMKALLAEPDDLVDDESDDALMERARRAALADMKSLLAEPDEMP
jgi:Stress responsive A/B Barrel Domain